MIRIIVPQLRTPSCRSLYTSSQKAKAPEARLQEITAEVKWVCEEVHRPSGMLISNHIGLLMLTTLNCVQKQFGNKYRKGK